MTFISSENLNKIREKYPKGTRIKLISMNDPQAPPYGTIGIVRGVDDIGSLMVSWENGSGLNILWDNDKNDFLDKFEVLEN